MPNRKHAVVGVLVGLFLVAACSNNANPGGSVARIHIQDVQSDTMMPGTAVELHGVIVTAVDSFGANTGDLWVEEPGGGESSGVRVVNGPIMQVTSLVPGDVVDITGAVKREFALSSDPTGRTTTELQPPQGGMMSVTKTGTGTVPPPHIIDAVALGLMTGAQRDAVYEKWEGVLIEVQNVSAQASPVGFGSTTPYPDDAFKFEVSGKLVVESTQAKFPSTVDGTTCLASITGVEDYVSDWLILPRSTAEIVTGGTGCPAPPTTTVTAIQAGTITGTVKLSGVYVTARELTSAGAIGTRLWVSDALQGTSGNGVMLSFSTAIDPSFVVGARVDVQGTVSEFDAKAPGNTLTELATPTVTLVSGPVNPPLPAAVTAAQVGDITTGEPFEGVLVQMTKAKVSAFGANNQVTLTDSAGGTVTMGDDVFANYSGSLTSFLPAVGTCFDTITGVMSVQTVDDVRTLNPRSAADMVVGTSCNIVTIQDVQSDAMIPGTPVELHGVVVTAIDTFGVKTGDLWVEEPSGGPFSGIHLFGTPIAQVASLAVGDIVDITGAVKVEFALATDTTGRTVTELEAPRGGTMTVTKTGIGVVPAPFLLDAAVIDAMTPAARDAEYERWEGVLVQVANVRSRSYPQGFGVKPYPDDAYKFGVTGTLLVESTQTKLSGVDGLTCFASITGVEDYFFDWLLLPRSVADVVTGTNCAPLTITPSTIPAIQAALPTGVVELDNVYVTEVSSDKTSFWMSTSPAAAPTEGGYVFQSTTSLVLDPAIVPGVQVDVIGTVTEFNDDTQGGTLTEVQPLRISVVNAAPGALVPVAGVTVATLLDPATAPLYESVLLTLDNVNISALGATANGFIATATQNGTTFGVETDILHLSANDLACYKTVTGFWTNLESTGATTKPNAFGFIVRDLGTRDGTCN